MRVAVAVLTYRPFSLDRDGLLRATLDSLTAEADAVYLVLNGQGDVEQVREEWPTVTTHCVPLTTCGHGTNLQARVLAGDGADLRVHSDDDMAWRPGWRERLEAWWAAAPDKVALTGCHVEADYPWNMITGRVAYGGVPGLLRASTGAASWSYRAADYPLIFPIPQQTQGWGDVPGCRWVWGQGRAVAQIDLAGHVGAVSTWGNRTHDLHGADTDPVLELLNQGALA